MNAIRFSVIAHHNNGEIKVIGSTETRKEAIRMAEEYAMKLYGLIIRHKDGSEYTVEHNGIIMELIRIEHAAPIETGHRRRK
jgi:hypothetical protein